MWLVDTSVWVDHLRSGNAVLARALNHTHVLGHPWVLGEIALGSLKSRVPVLQALRQLPQAVVASDEEVLHWLEVEKLYSQGLGFVDVALLAATRLTPHTQLWTHDKRLAQAARRQTPDARRQTLGSGCKAGALTMNATTTPSDCTVKALCSPQALASRVATRWTRFHCEPTS